VYITSHVVVEASKLCVCGYCHFVVVIVGNIVIITVKTVTDESE